MAIQTKSATAEAVIAARPAVRREVAARRPDPYLNGFVFEVPAHTA